MKNIIIGYVPPPTFGFPEAFLTNIRRYKTVHDLVLFSDYPWPDTIRIKASPEVVKPHAHAPQNANKWAVNNLIWLTALRIAMDQAADYILYLESDCRVGADGWDATIFNDAFNRSIDINHDFIGAGSMVWYSPCSYDQAVLRKWESVVRRWNKTANVPIPTYGVGGVADKRPPCCFVNGALGVYNMKHMTQFFDLSATTEEAKGITAWDFEIGIKTWEKFGMDGFDKVIHLTSMFSSYGDLLTTEDDRRAMLSNWTPYSRNVVAVHQIKSPWEGPDRPVAPEPPQPEPSATAIAVLEPVTVPTAKLASSLKSEFLVVSSAHEAEFCNFTLQSIAKYAGGFDGTKVAVPAADEESFKRMCDENGATLVLLDRSDTKGSFRNITKCTADQHCPGADVIWHLDSDCVLIKPVTPVSGLDHGKPVLWFEQFEPLAQSEPSRYKSKVILGQVLGWDTAWDTMCRYPAVHPRWLYSALRSYLADRHGVPFETYVLAHPFDAFKTLGCFAHRLHYDAYVWVDVTGVTVRQPATVRRFATQFGLNAKLKAELTKITE